VGWCGWVERVNGLWLQQTSEVVLVLGGCCLGCGGVLGVRHTVGS
jgi:hypothetical protein